MWAGPSKISFFLWNLENVKKKKLAGLSTYAIPVLTLPPFSLRIPELQGTALYSGIQLPSYAPQGWAPTLL